jgi:hypothetical protein
LEEAAVRAGCKVLMEADDSIFLIVGYTGGIIDQQLRPHLIYLVNIIHILIFSYQIVYY